MFNPWAEGLGESSVTDMTIEQELANPEQAERNADANYRRLADAVNPDVINLSLKNSDAPQVSTTSNNSAALRYPVDPPITSDGDFMFFQFYDYKPPFANRAAAGGTTQGAGTIGTVIDYNDAAMYADSQKSSRFKDIIMYMPEDISTGFRSNWGGKAFSNTAADALRAAGADGMGKLEAASQGLQNAIGRATYIAGAKVIRGAVNKLGGDSLSNDDVFGAISGAILNPNTELLFSGVDMRNFQLKFRLVPRNQTEAVHCAQIIATFKAASLPARMPGKLFGNDANNIKKNFIGFPSLCRVAFMHGTEEHKQLPRFKMCALTQVDVGYTPDGMYATYADGTPVATDLTLNFQETKIVFSEEVAISPGSSEGVR
jgi:hypothetical protein|tara:strand:- start:39 stop:1157 length:1119 start_codon:yes stop_codon:yes gene_type:complete